MLKLIAKLFGTKSEKRYQAYGAIGGRHKAEGEKLKSISNDELARRV